jgi:branched-chain amino acid transport system ATP-binding protein
VSAILELDNVEARYGDLKVLRGVSMSVEQGQIVTVLGANGAGKTTLLRAISNVQVKRSGTITFAGQAVGGKKRPEDIARQGIAHVPDGRGTFSEFTVWENLRLGAYCRRGPCTDDFARVLQYFPWIEERREQEAGTLSGGEQQMLALARAFMTRPKLMLLDEPSLGLAPIITADIFRIIKELNENEGVTVLVVEQNANVALQIAHRAYVLEVGRIATSGTSEEMRGNEQVRRSYLGY